MSKWLTFKKTSAFLSAMIPRVHPKIHWVLAVIWVIVLSGCAGTKPLDAHDPWERYNRAMYQFNAKVDKAILKPTAKAYDKVTPSFIDAGIDNFFSNLDDVVVVINDVLQLKGTQGLSDTGRLIINSTLGVLGLFDVATRLGLHKHREDFGQTLGHWGVSPGPYLVLPLLGPSTVRDGIGRVADGYTTTVTYNAIEIDTTQEQLAVRALDAINTRQGLLGTEAVFNAAKADPYIFLRESYLQRRESMIKEQTEQGSKQTDLLSPEEEEALFGESESP